MCNSTFVVQRNDLLNQDFNYYHIPDKIQEIKDNVALFVRETRHAQRMQWKQHEPIEFCNDC